MLHPEADEFGHVLMYLLLECGDEVVKIEAAAAPRIQHVAERGTEGLCAVAILKRVKE
jgi:hypothetical protein